MTPEVPQDFRGLLKESTVADCGAFEGSNPARGQEGGEYEL